MPFPYVPITVAVLVSMTVIVILMLVIMFLWLRRASRTDICCDKLIRKVTIFLTLRNELDFDPSNASNLGANALSDGIFNRPRLSNRQTLRHAKLNFDEVALPGFDTLHIAHFNLSAWNLAGSKGLFIEAF